MIFSIIQVIYDAIADLEKQYKVMMRSLAYSILKDYQYAEDAVQEALISLSKNMDKIDNIHSDRCRNYVYTITKNRALRMCQEIKNENTVQFWDAEELNNIEGALDVEAFADKYGFSHEMTEAISMLDETDKDILCYKYGAGYSGKEIAKMMDCSTDAVYKRLQRATAKLKDMIENMRSEDKDE